MPSDDSDGALSQQVGANLSSRTRKPSSKLSRACVHCKSLKVRCEFSPNDTICQRCRQAGHQVCTPHTRKKRKPAPTHEDLQSQADQQDQTIRFLLEKFDQIHRRSRIQKLISDARDDGTSSNTDYTAEIAVASYFQQDQRQPHLSTPPIVHGCSLYPAEILALFDIYFERINPFFSILDPDLHGNPADLIWSSPFLFAVICTAASRFYTAKPNLYPTAHAFAREAAAVALLDGSFGLDICQAYLILAVYPIPKKKFVDDRSWLFMGVAIRMAIALGLNQPQPTPPQLDERESLNCTRTWLNCFCVDASHAIQFGKMPMLNLDDFVARTSQDWYKSSSLNCPFDVHLCAYVSMILLMAKWKRSVVEVRQSKRDIVPVAIHAQNILAFEMDRWSVLYEQQWNVHPLPICLYRGNTTRIITAYLRLVILADGFQQATKKGISRDSDILMLSIETARKVIDIALDKLQPTGNLRYAMDANFVYISFAAAFLLNLLRPRFFVLLREDVRKDIALLVARLIRVLDSVALDDKHTPALYSRFLESLLLKYTEPSYREPSPDDDLQFYHGSGNDDTTPLAHPYSWPDIALPPPEVPLLPTNGSDDSLTYQQCGELDMDLSLSHFMRAVDGLEERNNFEHPRILDAWMNL